MAVIQIAAIDDDRFMLNGLASWLAPVSDLDLTTTAPTVADFVVRRRSNEPGTDVAVVLLDLNLRDGTRPANNVRELLAEGVQVLIMSTIPDPAHVLATAEAGASGYVTKDNDLDVLVDAIRRVAAGEQVVTPELALVFSTDERPQRPELSAQEAKVLHLYASGATLEATARRAGISPGTAREYLDRVKRKYAAVGRPTYTKLDLANRLREDRLDQSEPDPSP